jgi:hypothetical protein
MILRNLIASSFKLDFKVLPSQIKFVDLGSKFRFVEGLNTLLVQRSPFLFTQITSSLLGPIFLNPAIIILTAGFPQFIVNAGSGAHGLTEKVIKMTSSRHRVIK